MKKFECLLGDPTFFTVYDLDYETAKVAAQVRAQYGLKTPDAIQWAAVRVCGADFFLTNDREFKKINDPRVVLIEDLLMNSE